jgi:hypothetical protein
MFDYPVAERSQSITFRFSLFILHFLGVIKKDTPRRRKVIIKLSVPYTPEEGKEKATGNTDADEKKEDDCAHFM